MTPWKFIRALVPRPRRAVTLRDALPLGVFAVVATAVLVYLDRADVVLFTTLKPFWLLLPGAMWIWWLHVAGYSGLRGWRADAALGTRLLLLLLFVMVLAEPRSVRTSDAMQVLYVVDRSHSIPDSWFDAAMNYVLRTGAEQKPMQDEAGLVFFGRDAAVELPLSKVLPYEAVNVAVDRDGSDLSRALSLAGAMLTDDRPARIVLATDGTQTEGSLTRVLDELRSRSIPVDVLSVPYRHEKEVWVEKLELPRFVKVGETYEAAIIVSALTSGKGQLRISENGRELTPEPLTIEYAAGKNRYTLPIYLREPGYYEYEAVIEVPQGEDHFVANNRALSYLFLRGEGKVLLVRDDAGPLADSEALVRILREAQRDVEVINAYDFPRDPLRLMPFDAVVFCNVPREMFDLVQLNAMKDAVYNLGVGFLMVGGDQSFGPGGYHRTPIEETLPVTMDITARKVMPKGALVVVLHTCEFDQGNTWGKKITKQAIKVLGDRDEVGVLVFSWEGGVKWLFNLTPAGEYERLSKLINGAEIGDMPSFEPTMKMALAGLKASDASAKHVIIISDGDPSPPPPAMIREFQTANISVTTICVFPHGGSDISVMQQISKDTKGKYYKPDDASKLPEIFIREAKTLRRSMIQNATFMPRAEHPSAILKGITATPPLHGYVLTSAKPRSEVILRGPSEEEVDPVLATWNFGIGKAAAWTSDLSPNWARDWLAWDQHRAFVQQLVTAISRSSDAGHTRMQAFTESGEGVIMVEDYAPEDSFLEVHAQIEGPRNTTDRVALRQVGPRRYEGRFPITGEGRYQVMALAVGDGRSEKTFGGFEVPYAQEYLKFSSSPIVLEQIARRTGGRVLDGQETGEDLFNAGRDMRKSSQPIPDWFLILLACLIPLDVAIRRVQIDMETIRGWLGVRRHAPSEQTFDALLKRKASVSSTQRQPVRSRDADRPIAEPEAIELAPAREPGQPLPPAPSADAGEQPPPKPSPKSPADDAGSTTSRLLALKRRRQDDPDPSDTDKR